VTDAAGEVVREGALVADTAAGALETAEEEGKAR
jgi:hypothetical protein